MDQDLVIQEAKNLLIDHCRNCIHCGVYPLSSGGTFSLCNVHRFININISDISDCKDFVYALAD